jgi:hypothetical protein
MDTFDGFVVLLAASFLLIVVGILMASAYDRGHVAGFQRAKLRELERQRAIQDELWEQAKAECGEKEEDDEWKLGAGV